MVFLEYSFMVNSSTSYFSISPKNESDIEGIIHQNPSIQIHTYASSVVNSNNATYGPQNPVNHSSPNFWWSENTANQWIVINFTSFDFFTTHYSVQSTNCNPPSCNHAKQWKLYGSRDNEWNEIDEVLESKINGPFFVETRPVSNFGPFNSFKILSTGQSWNGNNYFRFLNIDFFGYVIPSPSSACHFFASECNCNPKQPTFLYLIMICFNS